MEVSRLLQRSQVMRDGRCAGQADLIADLAQRRRVTAFLYRLPDYLEHPALAPGQHMIRISAVRLVEVNGGLTVAPPSSRRYFRAGLRAWRLRRLRPLGG
jgi:hypothetical protein